jgi:drug/metabolite transporter (DMT)-like permease
MENWITGDDYWAYGHAFRLPKEFTTCCFRVVWLHFRLGEQLFEPELARPIAIALAVIGAIFLALGAQFQNDAVTEHHAPKQLKLKSLHIRQVLDLLRRPRWLAGTVFMGLAIISQLSALALAPLIVVQPIGAIALIITSILNARIHKIKLDPKTFGAIAITMLGVSGFVLFTATSATQVKLDDAMLLQVVGVLIAVLAVFGVLFATSKGRVGPLQYIFGAGVLYGFVASLAKVVIQRIIQGDINWLTLLATLALLSAAILGGWFVQNAYAAGPPDLVIAGLTVIDPAVAVGIAIVILGEASTAAAGQVLGFGVSGLVAVLGVLILAKVHPQLSKK